MDERAQQLKEKEMQKKQKDEEEKLWAMQQEHMRRMQILNDREMKRKERMVAENTKETHQLQAVEHKQKWKDPYGDRS